jgi:pimeloyl-[acyl-carrier protein] methyl ester esterase
MTLHVESAGAGAPLVLLHGWGLHGGLFAPLLPALTARRRVHVVDLPGHGHSAPVAPCTLDACVDAVAAAIDASAGAQVPVSLLGWSFGGLVAQRYAARFPARAEALLLVCTTPRFASGDGWRHAIAPRSLARFADELRVAYAPTICRFMALQMRGVADARPLLARMNAALDARPKALGAALDCALAILEAADLRAAAPTLACATLVVSGARDALTPPAAGAWLAAAIPGARYEVIAGAAHVPFWSHPAEFEAAIMPFIDGGR